MKKKSKIIIGVVALEVLMLPFSMPVAAQIIDKVVFSAPPRAAFIEIPQSEPGKTVLLVASNAPFSVISKGMVGNLSVDVEKQGFINGKPFGANAQEPGMGDGCVFQATPKSTRIYQSVRKTAARRGDVIDQAVKIEIRYDKLAKPVFDIKPTAFEEVKSASPLIICADPAS